MPGSPKVRPNPDAEGSSKQNKSKKAKTLQIKRNSEETLKNPKKARPAKHDQSTQTPPSKATQTADEVLRKREEEITRMLGSSHSSNNGIQLLHLDVRIPQLTLKDIIKYSAETGCEIRLS